MNLVIGFLFLVIRQAETKTQTLQSTVPARLDGSSLFDTIHCPRGISFMFALSVETHLLEMQLKSNDACHGRHQHHLNGIDIYRN